MEPSYICKCAEPIFTTPVCRNCRKVVSLFRERRKKIERTLRDEIPLRYRMNFPRTAHLLAQGYSIASMGSSAHSVMTRDADLVAIVQGIMIRLDPWLLENGAW